jgi:hypothetical protein
MVKKTPNMEEGEIMTKRFNFRNQNLWVPKGYLRKKEAWSFRPQGIAASQQRISPGQAYREIKTGYRIGKGIAKPAVRGAIGVGRRLSPIARFAGSRIKGAIQRRIDRRDTNKKIDEQITKAKQAVGPSVYGAQKGKFAFQNQPKLKKFSQLTPVERKKVLRE